MSIAKRPSEITLPPNTQCWVTVFEFLIERFPHISKHIWEQRIAQNKVHWYQGERITLATPYQAGRRVCYYREVTEEPTIPFKHNIIFQNEHIIIADKPHFLQVTPGGSFVNECLLQRLKDQLATEDIVPLHRLDRDTAGLIMFSVNSHSRAAYYQLFAEQNIHKTYHAIAKLRVDLNTDHLPIEWEVINRIEQDTPHFLRKQQPESNLNRANAHSLLKLVQAQRGFGLFELTPKTGKTHQLRLHMLNIGMPILNDRFYPILKSRELVENYQKPLQLLAKRLTFKDPVTEEQHNFQSTFNLALDAQQE